MGNVKIKGVKQAVGDFKHEAWAQSKKIMLNLDTGRVWCDCFLNCNTWIEYHDPHIVHLAAVVPCEGAVSMSNVRAWADWAIAAYRAGKLDY